MLGGGSRRRDPSGRLRHRPAAPRVPLGPPPPPWGNGMPSAFTPLTLARPRPLRTSTLPPTLTSARPPTRAWEVARTVVAPPSSVFKCLWDVFVLGFGVLFLSCVCVSVSGVLFSVGVCVCDLLMFLHLSLFIPGSAVHQLRRGARHLLSLLGQHYRRGDRRRIP